MILLGGLCLECALLPILFLRFSTELSTAISRLIIFFMKDYDFKSWMLLFSDVTEEQCLGQLDFGPAFTSNISNSETNQTISPCSVEGESISDLEIETFIPSCNGTAYSCYDSNAFLPSIAQDNFELLNRVFKNVERTSLGLSRRNSTVALLFLEACVFIPLQVSRPIMPRCQESRAKHSRYWPGICGRATIQFPGTLLWNNLLSAVKEVVEYLFLSALVKVIGMMSLSFEVLRSIVIRTVMAIVKFIYLTSLSVRISPAGIFSKLHCCPRIYVSHTGARGGLIFRNFDSYAYACGFVSGLGHGAYVTLAWQVSSPRRSLSCLANV